MVEIRKLMGKTPTGENTRTWGSALLLLCVLGFLWFRLIDHLRLEWALNPQYAYGWAVPFLCLYLLWRKAETLKTEMLKPAGEKAESRKQKPEYETTDH